MKRYALVIANPGELGAENYCEGVNKDAQNYGRLLKSPVGGAWLDSEIRVLNKPSISEVRLQMAEARKADYAFIVFAGHGYYSATKRSTILELRRGDEIDSVELRVGAKKQSLILDCCRKIERVSIVEKRAMLAFADSASRINAANCRRCFDKEIEGCPEALVVIHSCAIGQTAGDDSEKGGYYSYNLMDAVNDWESNLRVDPQYYYAMNISRAHDEGASRVVRISGGRQTPQIEKPRSEPYFPLGIVSY